MSGAGQAEQLCPMLRPQPFRSRGYKVLMDVSAHSPTHRRSSRRGRPTKQQHPSPKSPPCSAPARTPSTVVVRLRVWGVLTVRALPRGRARQRRSDLCVLRPVDGVRVHPAHAHSPSAAFCREARRRDAGEDGQEVTGDASSSIHASVYPLSTPLHLRNCIIQKENPDLLPHNTNVSHPVNPKAMLDVYYRLSAPSPDSSAFCPANVHSTRSCESAPDHNPAYACMND